MQVDLAGWPSATGSSVFGVSLGWKANLELPYSQIMLHHVRIRRLRRGLVVALILVLAGVVINLLFSATPALPVGLLLAAAALFALLLLLIRGRV